MQAGPNSQQEIWPGWRNPDNFVVVSDVYPTMSTAAADLILPAAMWVEKEGAFGNAERRTQLWRQLVNAPGEARSDLWQIMEFSKRFKMEEVWPAELLAKKPAVQGKTLFQVLFENGEVNKFPDSRAQRRVRERRSQGSSASTRRRVCSRSTEVRARSRPRPRAVRHLPQGARPALAASSTAKKPSGASAKATTLRQDRHGFQFYGNPDDRA